LSAADANGSGGNHVISGVLGAVKGARVSCMIIVQAHDDKGRERGGGSESIHGPEVPFNPVERVSRFFGGKQVLPFL